MDGVISTFGFFTSGSGILLTIVLASLTVLLWDWRYALAGLFVIQLSIAVFAVRVHEVSVQWAVAHVLIMLLCTLILALSNAQVGASRSLRQPGNWVLRLLALVAVFTAWRLVNVEVALPEFPANQVTYLIGLMLCALVILGFGDNPLFTGVALLLWIIPVQLIVEVLLPIPSLVATLGILQLMIALTCGYLALADRIPRASTRIIATDITFPDEPSSVTILEDDSVEVAPLPGLPRIVHGQPVDAAAAAIPNHPEARR